MRTLLLFVLGAAALTGCFDPTGKYPERRFFVIEAVRTGPPRPAAKDAALSVRTFKTSRAFEGREIVYRLDDQAYEADFYNSFFTAPGPQLAEATRRWLADAVIYEHNVRTDSFLETTRILEGSVTALYGDYRDRSKPVAHLDMQFLLLDDTVDPPKAILHRTYRQRIPVADHSVSALVSGWSAGLVKTLETLESDIAAAESTVE